MAFIRGTDWGAYLSALKGPALPFKDLYDNGLLDFFVTRGCQEADYYSAVQNIKWAKEVGCKAAGSYYWHYPTWTPGYQLQVYSAAIELEKPDFIAFDMEDSYGLSDSEVTINAEAVCSGLVTRYPNLPLYIYTSADYINGHCPSFNKFIGKYRRWIACWPGIIPPEMYQYLSFDEIKQYPLPDWKVKLPTGWSGWDIWQDNNWAKPEGYGWPFVHQYDWNVSNLTVDELIGKEKPIVVDTPKPKVMYNPAVPIQKRAWWMRYPSTMKLDSGLSWKNNVWVDGVIIPAYSMSIVESDNQIYARPDTNFGPRANQIVGEGLRVSAEAILDAGYFPMRQFGKDAVEGWDRWNDIMARDFLRGIVSTPSYEYTQSGVRNLKFHPFQAIHVRMTEFHTFPFATWPQPDWKNADVAKRKGTNMVPDVWQKTVLTQFLDHLRFFILDGVIPNVPVAFETDIDWYNTYASLIGPLLTQRSDWLYLHIIHPKLDSTGHFKTLQPIYESVGEDLDYGIVLPEKFEKRVLWTGFTWRNQKCDLFNDDPLELSFYQETSDVMNIAFPMSFPFPVDSDPVDSDPVDSDPVDSDPVDPTKEELQKKLDAAYAEIDALKNERGQWEQWWSKVSILVGQAPLQNIK